MASERPFGEIITFYSYKGGTGRSMALVNVAYLLATSSEYGNKRVLMIDWDLEAPGLERFLGSRTAKATTQPGLVDFLTDVKSHYGDEAPTGRLPESTAEDNESTSLFVSGLDRFPLSRYVQPVQGIEQLFLMHAGRRAGAGDDGISAYWAKVRGLEVGEFYRQYGSFFTHFRELLMREFDVVLIDSRTGLTDIGGICTRVMPEKLVLVFAPNHQNIDGVIDAARRAVEYRKSSRDPRGLTIFPLASRVDASASQLRGVWWRGGEIRGQRVTGYQERFERLVAELYQIDRAPLDEYFEAVQIPHDSDYAYGEEIAAALDGTGDRFGIGYACDQLARRLTSGLAPWDTTAAESKATAVFISSLRRDNAWAGRLYDALVGQLGSDRVFADVGNISIGREWSTSIAEQLATSLVLVVIGPAWVEEVRSGSSDSFAQREAALALQLGRPVVPVLVGGVSLSALDDLPPELAGLALRQAFVVSDERWALDVTRLGAVLETTLDPPRPPEPTQSASTIGVTSQAAKRRGFIAWLLSLFRR
ncbi:MAG TPA: TIR domain-containing protein [Ilumatobacteraceae bacterium]|nr:TIR domain-containing protein [Ilumatobacteraceae bacterium]